LVIETIGLAIDPYPRKPDAALPDDLVEDDDPEEDAAPSPFAALKNWKKPSE